MTGIEREPPGRKALHTLAAGRTKRRDDGIDPAIFKGGADPPHAMDRVRRDPAVGNPEGRVARDDLRVHHDASKVIHGHVRLAGLARAGVFDDVAMVASGSVRQRFLNLPLGRDPHAGEILCFRPVRTTGAAVRISAARPGYRPGYQVEEDHDVIRWIKSPTRVVQCALGAVVCEGGMKWPLQAWVRWAYRNRRRYPPVRPAAARATFQQSLVVTARMNGIDPQTSSADVPA